MNIDLISSITEASEARLSGKTVIVIDMLRATSVIVTALTNGCKEVIPVTEVEAAHLNKQNGHLVGGERDGIKVEGFDFSNSPLEYTREIVEGKTITITTTNGTRALELSKMGETVLVSAMLNADATARKAIEIGDDIVFLNAGTYGEFSMDDFICSGYIISKILEKDEKITCTDIARTALLAYKGSDDIISFIKNAAHYKRMEELGFMDDVKYCCEKDISNCIAVFKDGKIVSE